MRTRAVSGLIFGRIVCSSLQWIKLPNTNFYESMRDVLNPHQLLHRNKYRSDRNFFFFQTLWWLDEALIIHGDEMLQRIALSGSECVCPNVWEYS